VISLGFEKSNDKDDNVLSMIEAELKQSARLKFSDSLQLAAQFTYLSLALLQHPATLLLFPHKETLASISELHVE